MSPENSVKIVNPTLELATKWRIIVVSAPRPLLSREHPLTDVSAGARHVKGALDAFVGRSESVWCIKGTGEFTPSASLETQGQLVGAEKV